MIPHHTKMHYLVVRRRISNYKKAWFTERLLDLIGECSRSEPASNGVGTSVVGKLEYSTLHVSHMDTELKIKCYWRKWRIFYLAILSVGQDTHISWVFNGCNYSSSKQNLLPCLAEIENWYTYTATRI